MINSDKIEEVLEKAGKGASRFSLIGAGHYNDSYHIDSGEGEFVLRIAPEDSVPKLFYEVDMMRSEVGIHKLVREKTSMPVPAVVYHDFSRQIIDRDYIIMEFLEGKEGAVDEKELGGYVAQLHAIKGNYFGYPERAAPVGDSWPAVFREYVELIFKDCLSCGVIDEKECRDFLKVYERYGDVVREVEPSLLHLDLWWQNILTLNGRISGILDFDRGLYGDVELEFAVLDTYGYSSSGFFEGYGRGRPLDAEAQIRQRLYIVYELIKYAFIRASRGRNMPVGRGHVKQCRSILQEVE